MPKPHLVSMTLLFLAGCGLPPADDAAEVSAPLASAQGCDSSGNGLTGSTGHASCLCTQWCDTILRRGGCNETLALECHAVAEWPFGDMKSCVSRCQDLVNTGSTVISDELQCFGASPSGAQCAQCLQLTCY